MSYRREHITPAERVVLGCACVLFAGQYGLISDLARRAGVSRQFLYRLRARTRATLVRELAPQPVGRRAARSLGVERQLARRAVLVLHQVVHASVRGIQECLAELFGLKRSVGWVQGVLAEAAARASTCQPHPPGPLHLLADELFAGGRPTLAAVDQASGLVVLLEPAEVADETSWGCAWLDLLGRDTAVAAVGADGAVGLAAGLRAAGLGTPRLDHWHTLRDLGRVAQWLEHAAYRALAAADRAARAVAAAQYAREHGRRPRVGRPLRAPTDPASAAAAAQTATRAIEQADGAATILGWVRAALRPVDDRSGQVRTPAGVLEELASAAALLRELGGRATAGAALLETRAAGLVVYLEDLTAALTAVRAQFGAVDLPFLAWAWTHRHALELHDAAEAWPSNPAAAQAVWAALEAAVRGTGLVENLNSRLAFPRATRRGLPRAALALFAVYHNHHRLARGKRAGHTPLELAGLASPHWLEALGYGLPPPPAPTHFASAPAATVTTLVA